MVGRCSRAVCGGNTYGACMQAFESIAESDEVRDKWLRCFDDLGGDGVQVRPACMVQLGTLSYE